MYILRVKMLFIRYIQLLVRFLGCFILCFFFTYLMMYGVAIRLCFPYVCNTGIAARLSGAEADDEVAEVTELRRVTNQKQLPLTVRLKLGVERLVERVGFFGILLMASIPNPLFDLAGLTCGYLLVPFWQFFGATAIGKAIIKMHIQASGVVVFYSRLQIGIYCIR